MKILQIYKTYLTDSTGGVEQVMKQIALGTTRLGVQNRILSLSGHPYPAVMNHEEAEIYRFPLNIEIASTGFSLKAIAGFKKLIQWADIVHYHYPWPFGDLLHFLGKVTKPSLVTYHSDIVRQRYLMKLYRPLQKAFLKSVNTIVASSPNYLASSETLSEFSDKTKVIPFGLNRSSYPIASLETMKKWTSQLGEKFFLFVGVLRYYKGLHILLEAIKGTDFPLVIVGSGPMEEELKSIVRKNQLKQVHFLGRVSEEDKMALLQLCLAMVFPSHLRSEAFGISLLEAAMMSKPLISSEIGTGTSYINVHEKTGFVVPPNDPDALKNAMQLLWSNTHLAEEFGRHAHARYLDLFTSEAMSKIYFELYSSLMGS